MKNTEITFNKQWFHVEMPDMDLPHSIFVDDPIQGECIAAFKHPFDALLYIKDLKIEQLKKEYKYLLNKKSGKTVDRHFQTETCSNSISDNGELHSVSEIIDELESLLAESSISSMNSHQLLLQGKQEMLSDVISYLKKVKID